MLHIYVYNRKESFNISFHTWIAELFSFSLSAASNSDFKPFPRIVHIFNFLFYAFWLAFRFWFKVKVIWCTTIVAPSVADSVRIEWLCVWVWVWVWERQQNDRNDESQLLINRLHFLPSKSIQFNSTELYTVNWCK